MLLFKQKIEQKLKKAKILKICDLAKNHLETWVRCWYQLLVCLEQFQGLWKKIQGIVNKRKIRANQDEAVFHIEKNTKKNPTDVRGHALNNTPVKDNQPMLGRKAYI